MKQSGIALIQVLLLSTILMVVLLSMNHQARQHIRLAAAVQQYTSANMALHSAEAEIIFNMLSNLPLALQKNADITGSKWNFHGKPFLLNDVTLQIQDTSGLISASSPNSDILSQVTHQVMGSAQLGKDIAAALADWQDKDNTPRLDGAEQANYSNILVRNGPLQFSEEWQFVKGVTAELYQQIAPLLTLFPQGVNINQQPDSLWRLHLPAAQVTELIRARNAGELTASMFQQLTGITIDEFTRFSTGPGYRINFTVKNADVRLSRELTLRLMPFQKQPFDVYEYRLRTLPTDTIHATADN
ncbi:type II secretion system protein GspK [Rheinheimera muenzenbergensis]|uniref:Type II secretion system protein GspK n=1 Tax=Rheinheimera muenzenbergensis TaxID=1193628 RepID=A0ABU8C1S1_9GAMM